MAKNHIARISVTWRISQVNRETFFNLLVKLFPWPLTKASGATIRYSALSAIIQLEQDRE